MSDSGRLEEYDPIIDRPMGDRKKHYPSSNFREEEINYEPRTNLTQLINKRNTRNSISAQLGGRKNPVST